MRGYLGGMVIGVIVGSVMTALYINNEREVEHKTRQVKAQSRKAVHLINNLEEEAAELIKR